MKVRFDLTWTERIKLPKELVRVAEKKYFLIVNYKLIYLILVILTLLISSTLVMDTTLIILLRFVYHIHNNSRKLVIGYQNILKQVLM